MAYLLQMVLLFTAGAAPNSYARGNYPLPEPVVRTALTLYMLATTPLSFCLAHLQQGPWGWVVATVHFALAAAWLLSVAAALARRDRPNSDN